jgi:hypothetical protein
MRNFARPFLGPKHYIETDAARAVVSQCRFQDHLVRVAFQ